MRNIITLFFLLGIIRAGVAQNPGGVSSNLQLWLRADTGALNGGTLATDGQSVNTWQDQTTARSNDATDVNLSPPTYRDNTNDCLNYNPVVDFDGTNDGLDFGSDYIYSTGSGSQNGMTWFAVVEPDATTSKPRQFIMDFGKFTVHGYGFYYGSSHYGLYAAKNLSGAFSGDVAHSNATRPSLVRYTVDLGTDQTLNVNGASPSTKNSLSVGSLSSIQVNESSIHLANSGPVTIGHQSKSSLVSSNGGRRLNGSIAEIIGYNADLSGADIARIESYLAIKYGLTLDNSGGGTNGDYIASDGVTTIWDASSSTEYHNNIIAIGRDDDQALNQKQSHTDDDTSRVYINTLAGTNQTNVGAFTTNLSYVVIGDNQGKLNATSASNSEMPGGFGLYSRFEREWKITNTSFTQDFNWDIKLNGDAVPTMVDAADLRFLVDDDGDFSNGGTTSYFNGDAFGTVISYSNPVITISGISTSHIANNSTGYFTIGSTDAATPLPVELLDFHADVLQSQQVKLNWQTASELNNDYFLVQRSLDGLSWETLARQQGAGTSTQPQAYTYTDKSAPTSAVYYRLQQVDYDGQTDYSSVVQVGPIGLTTGLGLYPNPANSHIVVTGQITDLKVFSLLGTDVTPRVQITQLRTDQHRVHIDGLAAGAYLLSSGSSHMWFVKSTGL